MDDAQRPNLPTAPRPGRPYLRNFQGPARLGRPYLRKRTAEISTGAVLGWLALLVVPSLAMLHSSQTLLLPVGGVFGYAALISGVTYLLYRRDKRRAQNDEWRTPESTLHLFELLGGWPGAFVAQRLLRHKTSKISYQITFWMIVGSHQWLAFDYLQSWRYTTGLLRLIFS